MAISINKPTVGGSTGVWGTQLNQALDDMVTEINRIGNLGGSGGTGGIPASTIAAKGDLIVGVGASTVTRFAPGTNGHILTADSTTGTGLAWKAPTTGGSSIAPGTLVAKFAKSSSQSIAFNTGQAVAFNTVAYANTTAGFGAATGGLTSYVPGIAGWYEISGSVAFANADDTATPRACWLVSAGVEVDASAGSSASVNGHTTVVHTRPTAIQMTASQAVALFAYQARATSAALNLYLAGQYMSSMTIKWLGA